MKPLFLEMQAFGPYINKQKIDFEELGKDGIFLIRGKTGSGKTTIFDAMTFALYGGSSGDEEKKTGGVGRNNFSEWRCRQAEDHVDTIVSFTFMEGGKKYNFKRCLVRKRTNFSEEYSAKLILSDGTEKELFENPKKADLNAKAEEIIGLSKEQFRQVVLLPQGQFERFIVADSGEKEQILNKLFNAERWSAYAEEMYITASNKMKDLDDKKNRVKNILEDVSVMTELIGEERLTAVSSVADLDEYLKALKEGKKSLEEQYKSFNVEEKEAQLDADRDLARKFKDLHNLENSDKELEEQRSAYDIKRNEQQNATEVDYFRVPISEYEAAEKALNDRKNDHKNLLDQLPGFKKASEDAEKALDDYKKDSPVQANTTKIGELQAKTHAYEEAGILKLEADRLYVKRCESEKALQKAEEETEKTKKEAAKMKEAFDSEEAKAKEYRDRYYNGIYGEIASDLEEDKPCPVCGNTHHPDLAKKTDDSISKDKVDEQEQIAKDARAEWDLAEGKHRSSEEKLKTLNSVFNDDNNVYLQAKASYEKNMESLIEGIEDLEALKKEISTLNQANRTFEEEAKRLTDLASKARSTFEEQTTLIGKALSEIHNAQAYFDDKKFVLDKLMHEKGYSNIDEIKSKMMKPEELKDLTSEIAAYDEQCSSNKKAVLEAKEGLKDKTEPDASKFEERKSAIDAMKDSYSKKTASFEDEIKDISNKENKLSKLWQEYNDNISQAKSDLDFAKTLKGSTGLGLQRYVLAIMFDQVIGEANVMLSKVHGGRYQLFRSDDKGTGNKKGLELKVFDRWSPEDKEGRSVRMLSGGEKFLVSLSLSIGMSTIAQKTGMKIDSLFIDEGFGTLDETSINDAMEILESVRKDNGLIGIISHVKLLEENIPTQLEVVKTDKGNYIKVG